MNKHPLNTKIKKPSSADAKAFHEKELKAFEKTHPRPDRELALTDPAAYETANKLFWKAWSDYTLTSDYQDKLPRSANGLVQDKFTEIAQSIMIEPGTGQFWALWDLLKDLDGFQTTGGRGSGSRNSPSDTWREDMYWLSSVAVYMHENNVPKTIAVEFVVCGDKHWNRHSMLDAIKRNPATWELFESDKDAARRNLKAFTKLMETHK